MCLIFMRNILILLISGFIAGCFDSEPENPDKPFEPVVASISDSGNSLAPGWSSIDLHETLDEISGITVYQDSLILCVEDENGKVYFLNPGTNKITRTLSFGDKGDYEGVAYRNGFIYVLRSDGALFRISDQPDNEKVAESYSLPYQHLDMEGLCFDPVTGDLLVAAKSAGGEFKDQVPVFLFSLQELKFREKPLVVIPKNSIVKQDKKKSDKKDDKKDKEGFSPSEIAVNPENSNLIFLDSPNNKWFEFTRKGELVNSVKLDKDLLPQPEGLTYANDGSVWISTEGKGEGAVLVNIKEGKIKKEEN